MLISASDEELIEKLVAVRGLGRWSVEMFACFGLKRMDVFSTGDLGVQYVHFRLLLTLCCGGVVMECYLFDSERARRRLKPKSRIRLCKHFIGTHFT